MALITEILCRIYGAYLELISFFYLLSFLGCSTIYLLTTLPNTIPLKNPLEIGRRVG